MSTNDPLDEKGTGGDPPEAEGGADTPMDDSTAASDAQDGEEPMFDERITSFPWFLGVLSGTWTFVAGYVLMAAIMLPTAEFAGGFMAQVRSIGHVYYNAQFVPLVDTTLDGEPIQVVGLPTDWLAEGATSLPVVVYYAVPVVVLLVGGAVLAFRTLPDGELEEYVLPGVSITVGYLAMALLARLFVEETIAGAAVRRPDIVQTLVFALVYPLVLATAGGLAVGVWRHREELLG